MMSSESNDSSFSARLRFLPEGGRSSPVMLGYRPQLWVADGLQSSCTVTGVDPELSVFVLGEEYLVRLWPMFPVEIEKFLGDSLAGRFPAGALVSLYEGGRKVAEGWVVEPPPAVGVHSFKATPSASV